MKHARRENDSVPLQSRYALSFARVCAHFADSLHDLCPEEKTHVNEKVGDWWWQHWQLHISYGREINEFMLCVRRKVACLQSLALANSVIDDTARACIHVSGAGDLWWMVGVIWRAASKELL